jgi:gamma-glutamyltranspeptidase/glutathione hydrolase
LHFYTEAARLAFADRAQYVSDVSKLADATNDADLQSSDAIHKGYKAPKNHNDQLATSDNNDALWQALISPEYTAERALLIKDMRGAAPKFGVPSALSRLSSSMRYAPMPDQVEFGTSHISVVDRFGNSVALTSSIESAFGAHRMVNSKRGLKGGFLLNSELTDFSFRAEDSQGIPIANRLSPGKRPRSSMSPTLVFELSDQKNNLRSDHSHSLPAPSTIDSTSFKGHFKASLGSPGGAAIIHFTAQTLWAMLKWNMSPQEAIDLGHFALISAGGDLLLESNKFDDAWIQALKARGQTVLLTPLTSGVQAIERLDGEFRNDPILSASGQNNLAQKCKLCRPTTAKRWRTGYLAGADNRREGRVLGN